MYQSQLQGITATGRGNGMDNLFFEDVIFLTGALSGVELWHCRVKL
jgi:hypothetical protein